MFQRFFFSPFFLSRYGDIFHATKVKQLEIEAAQTDIKKNDPQLTQILYNEYKRELKEGLHPVL